MEREEHEAEMIPIELKYREGTLPYKLQQEIDALRKQLEVVKTDLHDTTAQLVMDEEIEDMLRKQLSIAVEALKKARSEVGCNIIHHMNTP